MRREYLIILMLIVGCTYQRTLGDGEGDPEAGPDAGAPTPVGNWRCGYPGDSLINCGANGSCFNGITDKQEILDDPRFHFTTALTISACVNPNRVGGSATIVSKWYAPDSYMLLIMNGNIRFSVLIDAHLDVETTVDPGAWVHAVGTFDGRWIRIYTNGEQRGIEEARGALRESGRNLMIGNHPDSNAFSGCLDKIKLYNVALSEGQVKALAASDNCRGL